MAHKLILKFKDTVISEHPLSGEEITIGRKPENTICIDNLAVSGRHARVYESGDKVIIEDLGSTNGTFVDDRPVTTQELKPGDAILIGKHTLSFVAYPGQPARSPDKVEANSDKAVASPPLAAAPDAQTDTKAPAMPLGGMQLISGSQTGRSIELTAALTSIGKGEGCKIKVKGLTVGKQAAIITRRPAGYHIAHVEGMAKVRINGEAIDTQARILKDGDLVEIGDTRMTFFIKP